MLPAERPTPPPWAGKRNGRSGVLREEDGKIVPLEAESGRNVPHEAGRIAPRDNQRLVPPAADKQIVPPGGGGQIVPPVSGERDPPGGRREGGMRRRRRVWVQVPFYQEYLVGNRRVDGAVIAAN